MDSNNWAKKEIEIACKRENPDLDGESFDYGCACYQSALKAYNSLLEDNHSGFSIGSTKNILNRLIDHKPLTPVTAEDTCNVVSTDGTAQCSRMSSLFRNTDGTYNDVDRVVFYEADYPSHFGVASRLIDSMFPLTLPYYPLNNPYKVYGRLYTLDEKGNEIKTPGEFNAAEFYYVLTPEGEKIELNKKYIEQGDGFVEVIA